MEWRTQRSNGIPTYFVRERIESSMDTLASHFVMELHAYLRPRAATTF